MNLKIVFPQQPITNIYKSYWTILSSSILLLNCYIWRWLCLGHGRYKFYPSRCSRCSRRGEHGLIIHYKYAFNTWFQFSIIHEPWSLLDLFIYKYYLFMFFVWELQDIVERVASFSSKGSRAICILAATGSVSTVLLHQPASNPPTVLRFQVWSLFSSSSDNLLYNMK